MKNVMNRLVLAITVTAGLLLAALPALARSVPLTEYNALRQVEVSRSGDGLTLRFEFKHELRQKLVPHYYKRSVQLDFDLTYVDPPKRYYPIEDSPLSEIYVSQFDSRLMRVRFILAQENGLGKRDFEFSSKGNILTVQVKGGRPAYDDSLDALLDRAVAASHEPVREAPQEIANLEESPADFSGIVNPVRGFPSPDVGENENTVSSRPVAVATAQVEPLGELVAEKLPEPKASTPLKLKDSQPEEARLVANGDGMESNSLWSSALRMVSTLAFVVGLMFLIFHLFKKWMGKQGMFGGGEKSIRVISTGFLGPKKSIAMVEVAGRVLILGVANDQITLLSSLENEDEVERILQKKRSADDREDSKTIVIPSTREQAAKNGGMPAGPDGKPDVYTSRKKRIEAAPAASGKKFSGYVKEYAAPEKKKARTVNDLKRMIRQRVGKVQVSA